MKKVVLVIASIMMQVVTAQMAFGQGLIPTEDIQVYQPSGVLGHTATFNVVLSPSSNIWYQGMNYGDLVFMVEYGESVGSMFLETDEEELDPQTGAGSVDSDYMQPERHYYYRTVVYREYNPSTKWVSAPQTVHEFDSGISAKANVVMSGPDTIAHRYAGSFTGVVTTPDFPGEHYTVYKRVCVNNTCEQEVYLGYMEANEIDTFNLMVEAEPGDFVSLQLKASNSNVGSENEWWSDYLHPASEPAVFLSVPTVTNPNMVLNGGIAYGGYDSNQWFEVAGPEQVVTLGPLNRGTYSGMVNESIITPTTPGIYTVTLLASNFMGTNETSVEFEILAPSGIKDREFADNVKVYPNPTTGPVTIMSPEKATYTVTSVTGSTIISNVPLEAGREEGLSLSSGMYMISIYGESVTAHKKIIVQ